MRLWTIYASASGTLAGRTEPPENHGVRAPTSTTYAICWPTGRTVSTGGRVSVNSTATSTGPPRWTVFESPGLRPDRSGSAARQRPGAAQVRRGALAGSAGRGTCVPQSGYLGGVTTTLGGVAPIYGCNSPQHGCNSPQHGQSGPKERFCSPGIGAHPANARPAVLPLVVVAARRSRATPGTHGAACPREVMVVQREQTRTSETAAGRGLGRGRDTGAASARRAPGRGGDRSPVRPA
ncbi:hypothetical protein ABH941_001760 [Streptacidiphilus sp. EB103A]